MGHVFGYFRVLLEMGTPERLRIAVSCMLIGPAYLCATDLSAQLVINEVCSANNVVLEAPEGDHPDWVELHNTGSSPIQLHDHYFSDKPSEPALWRLPVMVLEPFAPPGVPFSKYRHDDRRSDAGADPDRPCAAPSRAMRRCRRRVAAHSRDHDQNHHVLSAGFRRRDEVSAVRTSTRHPRNGANRRKTS